MSSGSPLFEPLALANGTTLANRICKAAMEENLATPDHTPGDALHRLYGAWARGGAGLILTGNVMVDARALTGPGGVVLDALQPLAPFETWSRAIRSGGAQAWMQINHPGRQVYAAMRQPTVAPSAVALDMGSMSRLFPMPREIGTAEIVGIIERFATTASRAAAAGFDGVQIHAAHGYLLSQFLSPLSNRRTDAWGGTLANRARLLLEIVRAVRARVPATFGVGVKLNSADFQHGGFGIEDAAEVVGWLDGLGLDLLEISGGSYESPAMTGRAHARAATIAREAYFVEFARRLAGAAPMPVMVTGGIRRREVAEAALRPDGERPAIDLVGIGRAMAYAPDLPERWRAAAHDVSLPHVAWRNTTLASGATMAMTKRQLDRMGAGRAPRASLSPVVSLLTGQIRQARATRAYRRWLERRSGTHSNAPPW